MDKEKDIFEQVGDLYITSLVNDPTYDFTLEELYQAIKARLMKELIANTPGGTGELVDKK